MDIRIYLDENVSAHLVGQLTAVGVDAISTNPRHKGLDDANQLLFARDLGRVFVSHNASDFKLLHRARLLWSDDWNVKPLPQHGGILILPRVQMHDLWQLSRAIRTLVDDIEVAEQAVNRMFAWNLRAGWNEICGNQSRPGRVDDQPTDSSQPIAARVCARRRSSTVRVKARSGSGLSDSSNAAYCSSSEDSQARQAAN